MVLSSARRFHLALLAPLLAVLMGAVLSYAKCDPSTDPDKTDIANARAAVAANCACAGALTHGVYVSCAAQQANTVLVNKSCAGSVKKCASHFNLWQAWRCHLLSDDDQRREVLDQEGRRPLHREAEDGWELHQLL